MSRLTWDGLRDRRYETGTDRGVLYLLENGEYSDGVAWNGLTAVTENPSGAEPSAFWADNIKYLNLLSAEDYGCTIEAYSYPAALRPCLGKAAIADGVTVSQQPRKGFGFSYRTLVGNAIDGPDYSYRVHVVYNCMASPPSKNYTTVNDSPEAITLSWEVSTTPVKLGDAKPTSEIVFDGPTYKKRGLMNVMHAVENVLYGTENENARIPTLEEIQTIYVYERYLKDSDGEDILDSNGRPIAGSVYD